MSLVVLLGRLTRSFTALSITAKVSTLASLAVVVWALYYSPVLRTLGLFIIYMTACFSLIAWLDGDSPSKTRKGVKIALILVIATNLALYGRESLTAKVAIGTVRSMLGGQPGCGGPAPHPDC